MCPHVGIDLDYVQWQQYSQAKVVLCVGGWESLSLVPDHFVHGGKGWSHPVGWAHPHAQNMANISRAVQERMHPSKDVEIFNLVQGGWEA